MYTLLQENSIYVDAVWLAIVFLFGLLAERKGLPPLVGFLLGGFFINFVGYQDGNLNNITQAMADIGVMLLLFTIGLKLKMKSLFLKEIWATSFIHMSLLLLVFPWAITLIGYTGLSLFTGLAFKSKLIISFALSFSSTVYVVKVLESQGELASYHGKIAIGILVIQDIIAVIFIAASSQKLPSIWVLALPIWLWILRRILFKLLDWIQHGEMVPLFGFFATFIAGAFSFTLFGLKADLGALIIGMLLVSHPRSDELYDRMISYKDFFLIAFFINVGLIGLPTLNTLAAALVLLPLVLVKGTLFAAILSRFGVKTRTVYLSSLCLTNFSEFGLIIGMVGLKMGLLDESWIITLALLMSFSFLFAAPINQYSHKIFNKFHYLVRRNHTVADEVVSDAYQGTDIDYLVVGMGRIGKPVFDRVSEQYPGRILGLDFDKDKIQALHKTAYTVEWADTADPEFWEKFNTQNLKAIYLTMSDFQSNLNTLEFIVTITQRDFKIFALTQFSDHAEVYRKKGVDFVFNFQERLGHDFVLNAAHYLENSRSNES